MKLAKALALSTAVMMTTTACSSGSGTSTATSAPTTTVSESAKEEVKEEKEEVKDESKEEKAEEPVSTEFVLKHTYDLVNMYDDVILDEIPQRIVTLSTYPVLSLYDMGLAENFVGVPTTTTLTYPDDLLDNVEVLPGVMQANFDIELIVAMEPDLVICPATAMSVHGETLIAAGIPVYAIGMSDMNGEMNVYEYMKHQTDVLTDAFALTSEAKQAAENINNRFTELEVRLDEVRPQFEGQTYLGLTISSVTDYYLQTPTSTLGTMLSMIGLQDIFAEDESVESSQAHGMSGLVNLEDIVGLETDLLVYVVSGVPTIEEAQVNVQAAKDNNPPVWNAIPAASRGDEISLTSAYVVTAGVQIIDSMHALIDLLLEQQ
ncbi:MAG: hypothetical protein ATN35_04855 [Epulopiscium sp. Nele67-Bin004]|nr:MAG: hypothetical protein ATN35_04855 [Epulopiscium sp. Nele67-Bin004]